MAEYFDLYDREGRLLGVRKARAQVHRDGDWHRSVALWIVRPSGNLVFQRRSLLKDTNPGLLTASVSGHYAAGEHLTDVLREAREEVGIPASEQDLVPLGLWRHEDIRTPGLIDRELQDVFLWPSDLPLSAFRPDPAEVIGLAEAGARDFLALLQMETRAIQATRLDAGDVGSRSTRLVLSDFVPMHEYHRRVALAAIAYTEGRSPSL